MFASDALVSARSSRSALAVLVARLDPEAVALPEVPELWETFDAVVRLATSARTLLARRVEEAPAWKRNGDRSAAEHLARRSGTSTGTARTELDTSKRLAGLPATEAAMRRGELSGAQASAVADAAAANPGAEQGLLDKAKRSSVGELRDHCTRAKAAADPDPEDTWRRLRAERRLRRFTDGDGAWNLMAKGTVDAGARFNAAFDPILEELFARARRQGRREPREAYAFDALIELAGRAAGAETFAAEPGGSSPDARTGGDSAESKEKADRTGGSSDGSGDDSRSGDGQGRGLARQGRRTRPTHSALLRLDLEALLRGRLEGDEFCEITGLRPVPVPVARSLLGDSVLKLVITRGVDVAHVTHLGRGPSAAQRMALLRSSPTCVVEGCKWRARRPITASPTPGHSTPASTRPISCAVITTT